MNKSRYINTRSIAILKQNEADMGVVNRCRVLLPVQLCAKRASTSGVVSTVGA